MLNMQRLISYLNDHLRTIHLNCCQSRFVLVYVNCERIIFLPHWGKSNAYKKGVFQHCVLYTRTFSFETFRLYIPDIQRWYFKTNTKCMHNDLAVSQNVRMTFNKSYDTKKK